MDVPAPKDRPLDAPNGPRRGSWVISHAARVSIRPLPRPAGGQSAREHGAWEVARRVQIGQPGPLNPE